MIGTKTASEIRQQFRAALARNSRAVQTWLDEEFAKLRPNERRDPKVAEELIWVRDALEEALKKKKRREKKAKKSDGKKKRVA